MSVTSFWSEMVEVKQRFRRLSANVPTVPLVKSVAAGLTGGFCTFQSQLLQEPQNLFMVVVLALAAQLLGDMSVRTRLGLVMSCSSFRNMFIPSLYAFLFHKNTKKTDISI
jgi:hypothetical protein